jgi:hypothetical protein
VQERINSIASPEEDKQPDSLLYRRDPDHLRVNYDNPRTQHILGLAAIDLDGFSLPRQKLEIFAEERLFVELVVANMVHGQRRELDWLREFQERNPNEPPPAHLL